MDFSKSVKVETKDCGPFFSQPSQCFRNVHEYVKENGGKIQFGWLKATLIFPEKGFIQTWNHHAVWRNDDRLLDITPQKLPSGAKVFPHNTVFISDDQATPLVTEDGFLLARLPEYQVLNPEAEKAAECLRRADRSLQAEDFEKEAFYIEKAAKALGGWMTPYGPAGVHKKFKLE